MELSLTLKGTPNQISRMVTFVAAEFPEMNLVVAPAATAPVGEEGTAVTVAEMMQAVSHGAREVLLTMARMSLDNDRHEVGSIELRLRLGDLTPSQLAGRIWSISSWSGKRPDKFKPYSQRWDGAQNVYYMAPEVAPEILRHV